MEVEVEGRNGDTKGRENGREVEDAAQWKEDVEEWKEEVEAGKEDDAEETAKHHTGTETQGARVSLACW